MGKWFGEDVERLQHFAMTRIGKQYYVFATYCVRGVSETGVVPQGHRRGGVKGQVDDQGQVLCNCLIRCFRPNHA